VAALAASGDTSLLPHLEEAMTRFPRRGQLLRTRLIAVILAGVQGTAALPLLMRAAARDLGDD
jgi:hypothetical protein